LHTRRTSALLTRLARTRAAAFALLSLLSSACADSLRPLGTTPVAAETYANQLFGALVTRFGPNDLSPKYDVARVRLAQAALIPSRVFNDTSIWETRPTPSSRALFITGSGMENGKYRLETIKALAPAAKPGDTRHVVALEQLGQISESVYRWDTRVDLAVGTLSADAVAGFMTALLGAVDGRTEHDLRADYRAAFPHAMAAFGRGFTIDSIRTNLSSALGTTSVAISASFHPDLMKPAFPALAKYLDKYLGPAKYRFSLADRGGAQLFEAIGRERSLTVRYRTYGGKPVTLLGPPRPWPDSVVLTSDVSLKVKLFTVGFSNLVTDFVFSNTGHTRAWTITARQEPQWRLPLFTESLIRSPLRRPFEGQGASLRLSVQDSAGAQTMLSRRTQLTVQESAIMRFLGGLGSHVLGELDAAVEAEEDRFFREGFIALESDLKALVPRWR
jgi:hypothetical protein